MDNQTPNQYNNGDPYHNDDNYGNGNNRGNKGNGGNNNGKKNHNGQMIMGFILVGLIALFLVSFFSSQFSQMSSRETTYTEFLEQLEKKNIKTVEFDSYEIDYTLVEDKSRYEITYYTGYVDDESLVEELKNAVTSEGKKIEVSAKVPDNTSTLILNILSFVIPFIFLNTISC